MRQSFLLILLIFSHGCEKSIGGGNLYLFTHDFPINNVSKR